jgi:hypothetical protein
MKYIISAQAMLRIGHESFNHPPSSPQPTTIVQKQFNTINTYNTYLIHTTTLYYYKNMKYHCNSSRYLR